MFSGTGFLLPAQKLEKRGVVCSRELGIVCFYAIHDGRLSVEKRLDSLSKQFLLQTTQLLFTYISPALQPRHDAQSLAFAANSRKQLYSKQHEEVQYNQYQEAANTTNSRNRLIGCIIFKCCFKYAKYAPFKAFYLDFSVISFSWMHFRSNVTKQAAAKQIPARDLIVAGWKYDDLLVQSINFKNICLIYNLMVSRRIIVVAVALFVTGLLIATNATSRLFEFSDKQQDPAQNIVQQDTQEAIQAAAQGKPSKSQKNSQKSKKNTKSAAREVKSQKSLAKSSKQATKSSKQASTENQKKDLPKQEKKTEDSQKSKKPTKTNPKKDVQQIQKSQNNDKSGKQEEKKQKKPAERPKQSAQTKQTKSPQKSQKQKQKQEQKQKISKNSTFHQQTSKKQNVKQQKTAKKQNKIENQVQKISQKLVKPQAAKDKKQNSKPQEDKQKKQEKKAKQKKTQKQPKAKKEVTKANSTKTSSQEAGAIPKSQKKNTTSNSIKQVQELVPQQKKEVADDNNHTKQDVKQVKVAQRAEVPAIVQETSENKVQIVIGKQSSCKEEGKQQKSKEKAKKQKGKQNKSEKGISKGKNKAQS